MGYGPWGRKESDTTSLMTSLVAQMVKCLSTMQDTRVQSLGGEDLLEKEMETHSSILAWKIPWTEEPGRLQSKESDMTEQLHFLSFFHLARETEKHDVQN